MASKKNISHLPLCDKWIRTKDGKGKRYLLEPGKRAVLEQYDQWEPHEGERVLEQLARVSISDKEVRRRELAANRLRDRFLASHLYKAKDAKGGEVYWSALQASRVLAD